ncbi:MAG: hypothetical protein BGO41_01300 [Clostridiales bacterium 38-18]|nr:MAG: hypothetical protein BGO41_01300 [Clostridiales bacterium 38-18]
MIKECINDYRNGEDNNLEKIISMFMPLIKKYNRYYYDEDISSEFVIVLIELVMKIDLNKFDSEGAIVNYISTTIKNKFIDLIRNKRKHSELVLSNDEFEVSNSIDDVDVLVNKLALENLQQLLSKKERIIIVELFVNQKKGIEIANELGLSKQNIHNIKKRALNKIKKQIEEENIWN